MASPASKPGPTSTRVMERKTTAPSPPAPIMAAMTAMERESMRVWLMPVMMLGRAMGIW